MLRCAVLEGLLASDPNNPPWPHAVEFPIRLDMMKDSEFDDFARKLKMDMDPIIGEKAAEIASAIQNTPSEAVEIARKFME